MRQFACHRLAVREDFSHVHQAKKLFQQYLVDTYVRIESSRLDYVRQNQSKLRVEHYKGLQDFVVNKSRLSNSTTGKVVILPSTFQGSPRNLAQRYQDAMAMVRKEGKPDIFLTFTCNPNWPEIKNELKNGEKPCDRPDIVSRVFRCKLDELKNDIFKKHVLGVVTAHVYVIEFQKRGLPHCHLLLILDKNHKFRDSASIDSCVSAELPDHEKSPIFYNRVLSHMVHGPCCERNPSSPCMKLGKCSKNYPKSFSETTIQNQNGYPVYRRRNNGVTACKSAYQVDNRDIVPFNGYLLLKYDAHINVEICSSIRSVKYLFKYIYKGYDAACVEFVEKNNDVNKIDYDETIAFTNMRYVSSHECIWRIHSNELHEQSHTIIRLAVHGPGHQNVYFKEGKEERALKCSESKKTTLTAWFELNEKDTYAHNYLYYEIPEKYIFDNNKWVKRKNKCKKVIGRMYGVSPNDTDRFYLRMLLLHVKGAKSFSDLLQFNGTTYKTFKEVVIARGLLQDDTEWFHCLHEMENYHMPKQLREMFAYICCFCEPTSPFDLWNTFKTSLTEDKKGKCLQEDENDALAEIENILMSNGFSCEKLGLPVPKKGGFSTQNFDVESEADEGNTMLQLLNEEQLDIAKRVLNAVKGESEEKLFFLEAPGGCGKTFLFSCLLCILRGQNQIALAGAWTGIASLLMKGGTTLHRLFGLPVPVLPSSVSSIKLNSEKADILRKASLILIDEASMIPAAALECIDRLLRDIMKNESKHLEHVPFGGKVILFSGDFRQVLPVVPKGNKTQILENSIQKCKVWTKLTKLSLKTNMRTNKDQQEFSKWLLQLGDGKLKSDRGENIIEIPEHYKCKKKSIVNHVFGTVLNEKNVHNVVQRAIVCPLNEDCDKINKEVIDLIEGESKEYISIDSIISDDPTEAINVPLEFLNSITPSGLPPHKLNLKIGAIVMLIRNMNLGGGLVNGVRFIIRGMKQNSLKLEIITGVGQGNIVFLPRIKLICTDPNMPFAMSRVQFPLRIAFAMTINKGQGQTFDKIGIFLSQPVFSHGQLYVAFSRVKSYKHVQMYILSSEEQGYDEEKNVLFTKNIVYQEVLI
ncbi:uncharacterized protein [Bemisia tabaci]|uniref:uncharacterized protein n=1 Tax=Bemisia tabaci TaxID=7038 RepID=UPI003B27FBB9